MKYHLLLVILAFTGCSKAIDSHEDSDCLDRLLKEHNMVPYDGNENFCQSIRMVECKNNKYYYLDCCICDMAFNPFDCDNNSLLFDEKTGEYSQEKQSLFDATFKNCGEAVIVGIYK